MRIAILGTRGIPANYGGFETFAEELSVRLVERGHRVTVYGRSHYIRTEKKQYRGVDLCVLPGIKHKYLDTPFHTFLSSLDVLFRHYDALLFCNSANAFCTFLPKIFHHRIALNVDGLEWQRAKWNMFGSVVYRFSEFLSTIIPHVIVTDAVSVKDYYLKQFNKDSIYIPYGANFNSITSDNALKQHGIEKKKYLLYVSRLEPENNAHIVVRAFEKIETDFKLVIVGDAPYSDTYIKKLKSTSDKRIIFTGYIFGEGYHEFQSHAYAYIQATEVGGTHPALVEAMGHGNCVLGNDVPEHREVLKESGLYFDAENIQTLIDQMNFILKNPGKVKSLGEAAKKRAQEKYSWERVTSDYEILFYRLSRYRQDVS